MRRAPIWFAVTISCVALFAPAPVPAMTGAEWRRLPEPSRAAYVVGVVDAWNGFVTVQESLGTKEVAITVFGEVVSCLRDRLMPDSQIVALVEKYAADNPGQWSHDMPEIVFASLSHDCPR